MVLPLGGRVSRCLSFKTRFFNRNGFFLCPDLSRVLAAHPLAAEPFSREPLTGERFAAHPLATEPLTCEPFTCQTFGCGNQRPRDINKSVDLDHLNQGEVVVTFLIYECVFM